MIVMKQFLLLPILLAAVASVRGASLVEGRIYLKNGSVIECVGDDRLQLPKRFGKLTILRDAFRKTKAKEIFQSGEIDSVVCWHAQSPEHIRKFIPAESPGWMWVYLETPHICVCIYSEKGYGIDSNGGIQVWQRQGTFSQSRTAYYLKKTGEKEFLTVCGAAAAAAALTACGGSASSVSGTAASASTTASSAAESAAGTLSGNVATGGSTSMKNVIAALTEGFAEVEPGVTVSYDPTGSGAGITGATDKTLDIGLSSRALKDDEKSAVDGTIVALDGIAIVVNKDSKVADLTVEQLKKMFTGEITNWKDVGGDDGEIVLVGREAGSGTRDGFESIVDVKDSCKYAQELTATGAVISAVEANPLAIGYASLSAVGDTVAMVTVEGVECSEDTVKDGSYKIQRPFVFVTNKSGALSEQAQAFVDFATSKDAADLIRTAGAVPVNE